MGELTNRSYDAARHTMELIHSPVTRRGMFDDEMRHLREYRTGDNPRDIHWRTSARHNQLVVREYHQSRDRGLTVLLELWLTDNATQRDNDHVELAVSFAATLCDDHLRRTRGAELSLFAAGGSPLKMTGMIGGVAAEQVLDELAVIRGDCGANIVGLAADVANHHAAQSRAVLITTRSADLSSDEDLAVGMLIPGLEIYRVTADDFARWFVPAHCRNGGSGSQA